MEAVESRCFLCDSTNNWTMSSPFLTEMREEGEGEGEGEERARRGRLLWWVCMARRLSTNN